MLKLTVGLNIPLLLNAKKD